MDRVGFEPTSSRVTVEVTLSCTTFNFVVGGELLPLTDFYFLGSRNFNSRAAIRPAEFAIRRLRC
jgi:hypothetical protein